MEAEKSKHEEVRKSIFQMSKLKNQLQKMGVVKSDEKIVTDYAEWFCSVKFGLELCDKSKFGYEALSKFGKKILIRSKIGSDIDFKTNFDDFQVEEFDYLLIVFINGTTWMIDSIYKVARHVVTEFLTSDRDKKFEWRRESRSLSLQLYPDAENMLPPVF